MSLCSNCSQHWKERGVYLQEHKYYFITFHVFDRDAIRTFFVSVDTFYRFIRLVSQKRCWLSLLTAAAPTTRCALFYLNVHLLVPQLSPEHSAWCTWHQSTHMSKADIKVRRKWGESYSHSVGFCCLSLSRVTEVAYVKSGILTDKKHKFSSLLSSNATSKPVSSAAV